MDTSTILDFLKKPENSAKNPVQQDAILTVQKIMQTLEQKSSDKNRVQFYVSAITLAELPRIITNETSLKRIVRAFHFADITVLDYNKKIAEQTEKNINDALPEGQQRREFEKEMEKARRAIDNFNARAWISDDLKILMTAKSLPNLDVILTSDKNTFLPIATRLSLPCLATYKASLPQDLFGEISTNEHILKK